MVDPSKIQGKQLSELFRLLIDRKIILSVKLEGTGYERLTYVLDLQENATENHLIFDIPDGFHHAVRGRSPWQLNFTFNGPDKLEYLFTVTGGHFHPQGLCLPFPEFIERIQRRRNFRIMTPAGTRMVITTAQIKVLLNVINISLGGAYGVIAKRNQKHLPQEPVLHVGQRFDQMGIIFTADDEMAEQIIVIKETQVRRIDHNPNQKIYKYAFEFSVVEPAQLRKLTQAIYHVQRRFLLRR